MPNRPTSRNARAYHGLGGTPTYRSWYSMWDRCLNKENASFKHYGAKGISVCERWSSIDLFVADMGLRPDGMTIDRKDRAGNYEPSNCQWASELDQQRNRGGVKLTVEIARAIRDRVANGEPRARVARDVGIDASAVSRIVTGESWRDA